MTAEQLLELRYELIADFPGNTLPIGFILTQQSIKSIDLEAYPHLFRKMNWWENRSKEEMPKQVYCKAFNPSEILDIQEWDMSILVGWINKERRTCCGLLSFKPECGYFPVD